MNDFILKLAKNNLVHERFSRYGESTQEDFYDFYPDELEQFIAEIVRECIKCSDPLVGHYIDKHTERDQALLLAAIADYSSEIKKHFGID